MEGARKKPGDRINNTQDTLEPEFIEQVAIP
jgi:hypothetical protein